MVTRNVAVVPPALRVMQSALLDRARDYQQTPAHNRHRSERHDTSQTE